MESNLHLAAAPEISLDRSCQGPSGLFHLVGLWPDPYLWLVGNGRMVVIVVIIVPHSSIPY